MTRKLNYIYYIYGVTLCAIYSASCMYTRRCGSINFLSTACMNSDRAAWALQFYLFRNNSYTCTLSELP